MVGYRGITYEEELKKNPELKESDVQMLREWCAKQPHLPKISDERLAVFLHSNYYSIERTKTKIETHYTMKTNIPEFFSNRDLVGSEELRSISKVFAFVRLKKPMDNGYRICYIKWVDPDVKLFNFNSAVKYAHMIDDFGSHIEGNVPGWVLVYNTQGFTLDHVRHLSLMGLKTYLLYIQQALPIRLKKLHFTNIGPVTEIMMRMVKPFMKKELKEKIHFHSTAESLEKFVPLDALPNEEGGKGGNLADLMAENIKVLEDNREWFQTEEATMRVNESLRPGKDETTSNLSGVNGSFKKLAID